MRKLLVLGLISTGILMGCNPSEPVVEYRSENAISYKYKAYGMTPTLTLQVRDMAQTHCAQYGKNAEYVGVKFPNIVSSSEIHEFTCNISKVQVDD